MMAEPFVSEADKRRIDRMALDELEDERHRLMSYVYQVGYVDYRIAEIHAEPAIQTENEERRLEYEQDGRQ